MYEVKVTGMTCGSCAGAISHVLKTIDPKVQVSVNLKNQIVMVNSDQDQNQIVALIEDAGFPVIEAKKVS